MSYSIRADTSYPSASSHSWQAVFTEGSATAKAYNMSLHKEMSGAGSLSFTIPPSHALYNSVYILGTTVEANASGANFLGRVIRIQTDFYKNKIVECEGCFSWLSDVIARPHLWYTSNEDSEERAATAAEYILWLSNQHNTIASTKRKANISFDITLFGAQNAKQIIWGNDNYKTCLDALNDLIALDENAVIIPSYAQDSQTGIYKLIVNIENITTYSGTVKGTINLQGSGANLIHVDTDISGDDIYTSVIPLGKDKLKYDGGTGIDYVHGLNTTQYGVIEKVSDYDSETTNGGLYSRASGEIQKISGKLNAITVQAVGLTVDLGDTVAVVDTQHGISGNYLVTALDISIDNPAQSTYTLYPCGSSYAAGHKSTITDIAKNGAESYMNSTSFADGESPSELIQEDDTYIKAVGQNWTTHYKAIEDSQTEGNYTLSIYRTENAP